MSLDNLFSYTEKFWVTFDSSKIKDFQRLRFIKSIKDYTNTSLKESKEFSEGILAILWDASDMKDIVNEFNEIFKGDPNLEGCGEYFSFKNSSEKYQYREKFYTLPVKLIEE